MIESPLGTLLNQRDPCGCPHLHEDSPIWLFSGSKASIHVELRYTKER
jgi:hypothetical protein